MLSGVNDVLTLHSLLNEKREKNTQAIYFSDLTMTTRLAQPTTRKELSSDSLYSATPPVWNGWTPVTWAPVRLPNLSHCHTVPCVYWGTNVAAH